MGTPTQYYCDPAIAANSGTGTIGDPFGDLQYALNTVTRDSTNGDQMNVKAGTDEILAAALSLATYGTPSSGAPLIIQGYTSTTGDGGIGSISGAGSFSILASGQFVIFVNMKLYNCGSAAILSYPHVLVLACELTATSGNGITVASSGQIRNSYLHNIGGVGIAGPALIDSCYFENGANSFSAAINAGGSTSPLIIRNNIIKISGSSKGVVSVSASQNFVADIGNNSIWSNGGTGTGIEVNTSGRGITVLNNIVEGFSGSGGKGIVSTNGDLYIYGNNKYYNNATHETLGDVFVNLGNNDALGASPFTNPAGDDFSVSTAVKAGAYPSSFKGSSTNQYLDVGAAQRQEPAGGGGSGRRSRIRGHGI